MSGSAWGSQKGLRSRAWLAFATVRATFRSLKTSAASQTIYVSLALGVTRGATRGRCPFIPLDFQPRLRA